MTLYNWCTFLLALIHNQLHGNSLIKKIGHDTALRFQENIYWSIVIALGLHFITTTMNKYNPMFLTIKEHILAVHSLETTTSSTEIKFNIKLHHHLPRLEEYKSTCPWREYPRRKTTWQLHQNIQHKNNPMSLKLMEHILAILSFP